MVTLYGMQLSAKMSKSGPLWREIWFIPGVVRSGIFVRGCGILGTWWSFICRILSEAERLVPLLYRPWGGKGNKSMSAAIFAKRLLFGYFLKIEHVNRIKMNASSLLTNLFTASTFSMTFSKQKRLQVLQYWGRRNYNLNFPNKLTGAPIIAQKPTRACIFCSFLINVITTNLVAAVELPFGNQTKNVSSSLN